MAPTIAIVGATGRTGKYVLKGALERGYGVRALARNPAGLATTTNVLVVRGSVTDLGAVTELVQSVDMVVSCLGTSKGAKAYVVEPGTRMLLEAIRAEPAKPRFVHMSSLGLGDSRSQCRRRLWSNLFLYVGMPMVGKELFADMERAEALIHAARDISCVNVRPTILNNKPPRGYRALTSLERPGKAFVSRLDVAVFMLDTVADTSWDGVSVSLFSA